MPKGGRLHEIRPRRADDMYLGLHGVKYGRFARVMQYILPFLRQSFKNRVMKQILQNLKSGEIRLDDVPAPQVQPGTLLIQTTCSLISAGTERMVTDFGKANYLQKALQKPDKVRQVLQKVKTDGVMAAVEAVEAKLDQPMALGYSNVGRVIAVGEGVEGFDIGDRVVSNGRHAEVVCVPVHLCAKIPDGVRDEDASFTVISAIALQGIRLVNPTLGEYVCVMGLGLIGLIAVQILKASGAQVIGFDFNAGRVEQARKFGVEAYDLSTGLDPVEKAIGFTGGQGIDGVLITAATKSNDVISQSANMCRQRGRVVLTGVVGLNIDRNDFYEKELTFQVSCSYGPGRYDPLYEEGGQDYPLGFVRWTEQRNFQAVLNLMKDKSLDATSLLSKRVTLLRASEAYDALKDPGNIGILVDYPVEADVQVLTKPVITLAPLPLKAEGRAVIGLIGAGSFTMAQVLPALELTGARLKWVASAQGVSASHAQRKFGIENATTDYRNMLADPETNAIVITTRHNSHARFVKEALLAGKHVFVEKPLCLNEEELSEIKDVYEEACRKSGRQLILMVGFNRRFSPLTALLKEQLSSRVGDASFIYTVNAGRIPADHWTQDRDVGGGRIVGEACHFIDYLSYLAGSEVVDVTAAGTGVATHDTASILLKFADGCVGQVNYFANGHKLFAKERIEAFFDGDICRIDNFRKLEVFGEGRGKRLWRQDKGHKAEFSSFVRAVAEGLSPPIPFSSIVNVMEAVFKADRQLRAKNQEIKKPPTALYATGG